MRYEGNVFRPPSEAYSLIVQFTVGCSNNTCCFCSMYKDKKFYVRDTKDVLDDFMYARKRYSQINRIFLADGDALIADTQEIKTILEYIRKEIPECERVSSYATPQSLKNKSDRELKELFDLGLKMIYVGLESGSETVLSLMNKRVTPKEISYQCRRAKNCGMKVSVTAISGLGGKKYMKEHALKTAEILSEMKPDYIGLLTLMVQQGTPLYRWIYRDKTFELLDPNEILEETKIFLENIDSENSVFRMNHASNYLQLRGTLNKDIPQMLFQLQNALAGKTQIRDEWMRGL